MKPFHTTVLLALVFCSLGAYLYWIELPTVELEEAQQIAAKTIFPFDDRDVIDLTVQSGPDKIVLQRDEAYRWHIRAPIQGPADSRAVQRLLRSLTIGKVTRVLDPHGVALKEYGLDPPYAVLTVNTEKDADTLALGNVDPISAGLYAKRDSDGAILLTTLSVQDFRNRSLHTFRQKEILPFNRFDVTQLHLVYRGSDLVLSQIPSAHGWSGDWQFEAPEQGPADKTAVNVLLMALEDLQSSGFVDSEEEKGAVLSQFGQPTARITLSIGDRQQQVEFFRSSQEPEKAYAVRSAKDPIYLIDSGFFLSLPREDFDLRDKRLFGMPAKDIALLSIKSGADRYVLVQQHDEWFLEDQPDRQLDRKIVKLFTSRIVDLPAEIRIQREEDGLERFGLHAPVVEVTGIDFRGRVRGRLRLGHARGGLVYAMGSGLPGIFQARSLILSQIPKRDELLIADSS